MVQFFNDTSTANGIIKLLIRKCEDVEKLAKQITKEMGDRSGDKLSSLMDKQAAAVNAVVELQGKLVESDVAELEDTLKNELREKLASMENALQGNLLEFDVSVNVKRTLLEYAKLQLEEQARMTAGYDEKGKYNIDEQEIKKAMPPVAKPKNI